MVGLGIGLGLGLSSSHGAAVTPSPLCAAMARKVCVTATEKGHAFLLAPHIVYTGNKDQHFLDAVVVERDGKAPNKPKLETFKVADLTEIAVTDQAFTPEAGFKPGRPKYEGKTICVVQIV
jgi:hypothetical protein